MENLQGIDNISKVIALSVHSSRMARVFGFSRNNCLLRESRAVHQTRGTRWNRFLVADDRTNALVHDTSITLRVAYPLSVQLLRFATPACFVSPRSRFVNVAT